VVNGIAANVKPEAISNKLKYAPGLKVARGVADWSHADSVTREYFESVFFKETERPATMYCRKAEQRATLFGKASNETSHWVKFLTTALRDKDGTPWRGVA